MCVLKERVDQKTGESQEARKLKVVTEKIRAILDSKLVITGNALGRFTLKHALDKNFPRPNGWIKELERYGRMFQILAFQRECQVKI